MLHFVIVERERLQLVGGEEVKGDCLILEALRPYLSNLPEAVVDVADLVVQVETIHF